MAIRKYKPTTNGRRNMSVIIYNEEITTDTPEKSLLVPLNKKAGRNAQGQITVSHKGGAEKRGRSVKGKPHGGFFEADKGFRGFFL